MKRKERPGPGVATLARCPCHSMLTSTTVGLVDRLYRGFTMGSVFHTTIYFYRHKEQETDKYTVSISGAKIRIKRVRRKCSDHILASP